MRIKRLDPASKSYSDEYVLIFVHAHAEEALRCDYQHDIDWMKTAHEAEHSVEAWIIALVREQGSIACDINS